jgi:hypothetical protein
MQSVYAVCCEGTKSSFRLFITSLTFVQKIQRSMWLITMAYRTPASPIHAFVLCIYFLSHLVFSYFQTLHQLLKLRGLERYDLEASVCVFGADSSGSDVHSPSEPLLGQATFWASRNVRVYYLAYY